MKEKEISITRFFKKSGEVEAENVRTFFDSLFRKSPDPGDLDDIMEKTAAYLREKGRLSQGRELLSIITKSAAARGINALSLSPDILNEFLFSGEDTKFAKNERKSDHDRRRNQIFDASIDVFSRKGYHGATMEEIATVAGIGKGSVYRYFKSKEDLLRQLLSAKYNDILERFSTIMEGDDDVLLQIQEMIIAWIEFIEKNYSVYNLIQNKNIQQLLGEDIRFYDFFVTHLPMLKEKVLERNRQEKLKTTDFYSVFYGILGFIDGVVQKWFHKNMQYPLRREIPVILEVLFNGFVGEKNSGKKFLPDNK